MIYQTLDKFNVFLDYKYGDKMNVEPIARIYTDFDNKFGIPRQSTLVEELKGKIVFEKEYAVAEAVRGLEEFSHLWLIWEFDKAKSEGWHPTVRPPRLGGNERVGVFASRSPFRPNSLGLSCVKLDKVATEDNCPVLYVSGIDMLNGTPIFDIKPYLPYVDSHADAKGSFAQEKKDYALTVVDSKKLIKKLDEEKQSALIKILESDPRPSYHNDDERVYGFGFGGYEIKFKVKDGVLTVEEIENE